MIKPEIKLLVESWKNFIKDETKILNEQIEDIQTGFAGLDKALDVDQVKKYLVDLNDALERAALKYYKSSQNNKTFYSETAQAKIKDVQNQLNKFDAYNLTIEDFNKFKEEKIKPILDYILEKNIELDVEM